MTVPAILLLLVFIYVRPHELVDRLRALPLLHGLLAMAALGFAIDLVRQKLQPRPAPQLWLAVMFLVWALGTIVVRVPGDARAAHALEVLVAFLLFGIIAHGVQSFRSFATLGVALVAICLVLAAVAALQPRGPLQCVAIETDSAGALGEGRPDGRGCETRYECYRDGDPNNEYLCEHVGPLGTTTIFGRVRYRGVLQDPNELALALSAMMPLLFALVGRRRALRWYALVLGGGALVLWCIIQTQSRSGQLAFLGMLGVYFVKRFGWRGIAAGAALALPVLVLGGRGGEAAEASTIDRYEAWRAAFYMLRGNPLLGVGHGMFTEDHHLTAHNSYLLAAAELGVVGMVLWTSLVYLSLKVSWSGMRLPAGDPATEEARAWGTAVFASLVAFLASMLFLSLTYHVVTWIYFGIAGAYHAVVRRQLPDWGVRFGVKDLALVIAIDLVLLVGLFGVVVVKGY